MTWLIIIVGILTVSFGGVLLFGAPYLPTLGPQAVAALELAALKKGQTILELGCGDGKVIIAAAEQGIKVIGYELNPILALICWIRTRRYGSQVHIVWGDFWKHTWPDTEAIFVFLLPKYMKKLDTKIIQTYHKPVTLISFAFKIPDKHIDAEKEGVFRYTYDK